MTTPPVTLEKLPFAHLARFNQGSRYLTPHLLEVQKLRTQSAQRANTRYSIRSTHGKPIVGFILWNRNGSALAPPEVRSAKTPKVTTTNDYWWIVSILFDSRSGSELPACTWLETCPGLTIGSNRWVVRMLSVNSFTIFLRKEKSSILLAPISQ